MEEGVCSAATCPNMNTGESRSFALCSGHDGGACVSLEASSAPLRYRLHQLARWMPSARDCIAAVPFVFCCVTSPRIPPPSPPTPVPPPLSAPARECSAIDYMAHTIDAAHLHLLSPTHFPSRSSKIESGALGELPSHSRRLYRCLLHAYVFHPATFLAFESRTRCATRFGALARRHPIVLATKNTEDLLTIPPLAALLTHAAAAVAAGGGGEVLGGACGGGGSTPAPAASASGSATSATPLLL